MADLFDAVGRVARWYSDPHAIPEAERPSRLRTVVIAIGAPVGFIALVSILVLVL